MNEAETKRKNGDLMSDLPFGTARAYPVPASANSPSSEPRFSLRHLRAAAEIHAISRALEHTAWNRRRAAELLSISYRGLLYKIRKYEITSATAARLTGLVEGFKIE